VYRDIPPELRELIEPVVEDHGCQLVDVEVRLGHGPGRVRVIVDSAAGDGRVPIDLCARVSRETESQLDAAGAIPGRYVLEVTSPGLDRVLAREKDFEAARGRQVRIRTRRPLEGRRRFSGVLEDFSDGVARLRLEDGAPDAAAAKGAKNAKAAKSGKSGKAPGKPGGARRAQEARGAGGDRGGTGAEGSASEARQKGPGVAVRIPFEDVEKANAVYEWSRDDFAGRQGR